MRKKQRDAIAKHVRNLGRIFPRLAAYVEAYDPVEAFETLRSLEHEANKLAEDQCNRPLSEGYVERKEESILKRLDALIGFTEAKVPVFCNGDPRGAGLKIKTENADKVDPKRELLYRDWGYFGIIAPDFSED